MRLEQKKLNAAAIKRKPAASSQQQKWDVTKVGFIPAAFSSASATASIQSPDLTLNPLEEAQMQSAIACSLAEASAIACSLAKRAEARAMLNGCHERLTHGQEAIERAAIEKFKQADNFKVVVQMHIARRLQKAIAEHKLDGLHCESSYLMATFSQLATPVHGSVAQSLNAFAGNTTSWKAFACKYAAL